MRMRPGEAGAALLAVLLLVAVMAALSVLALEKLGLATHLAANARSIDQARAYALGAEAFAAARVGELSERERTTLAGGWNRRPFDMPLPGGSATGRLSDGGNCFNLNSVAQGLVPTQLAARPIGIAQFRALMWAVDVPDASARRIAAALADWIDGDGIPGADGAEDETYLRALTPYRAANTLLADVSELRTVAGVTPAIYARLRPWLCALPSAELSPLNVNTLAPEQAPLLTMLFPGQIDARTARQIILARPPDGWEDMAQFWEQPSLRALVPPMEAREQVQLRTRWFALDLDLELGGAQVVESALIDGGFTPARVVSRRWGDAD